MKILFYTQVAPSKELGGSKVAVELAEEMEMVGWRCTVMGPEDVRAALPGMKENASHQECLRQYLHQHAAQYDVVDYDHSYLPYPRSEFSPQTLFVARSVLLVHHFERIAIPHARGIKPAVRRLLLGKREQAIRQECTRRAHVTVEQADLVNVSNHADKEELARCGISQDKVIVLPFGMSTSRRRHFDALSSAVPKVPVVGFVGTFDYRKGARDFPEIMQRIVAGVPDVKFRLIGTAGLHQTAKEVYALLPRRLASRVEVVPRFSPEQLPELLASCSMGIFPSYVEGFGFGVLEMLSAAMPVVAYNAPGPPMMLSSEFLVPPGDTNAMSARVIALLTDSKKLHDARVYVQHCAQQFSWGCIAKETIHIYMQRMSGMAA